MDFIVDEGKQKVDLMQVPNLEENFREIIPLKGLTSFFLCPEESLFT